MAEANQQINVEELKKMLDESNLSAEMKTGYTEVLEAMTEDERAQLRAIIEEKKQAEEEYEANRYEKLARLNRALEKHLADTLRDEEKLIREDFEKEGAKEDAADMKQLENELNNL